MYRVELEEYKTVTVHKKRNLSSFEVGQDTESVLCEHCGFDYFVYKEPKYDPKHKVVTCSSSTLPCYSSIWSNDISNISLINIKFIPISKLLKKKFPNGIEISYTIEILSMLNSINNQYIKIPCLRGFGGYEFDIEIHVHYKCIPETKDYATFAYTEGSTHTVSPQLIQYSVVKLNENAISILSNTVTYYIRNPTLFCNQYNIRNGIINNHELKGTSNKAIVIEQKSKCTWKFWKPREKMIHKILKLTQTYIL